MLLLTSTSDLIQVTPATAADIEVHASYLDNASGTITPGRTNTASITGTSATTVVGSPGASTQRNVKHLNITNNHATDASIVTITHTDGTNVEELMAVNLLAGENLVLNAVGTWIHYDSNGGIYPALPVATQTEMEAGGSLTSFVVPGRQHFHPSSAKFWVKAGVTANILASYNVSSLTDNGTGDITVNINTDFSSADYCASVTVEMTATTYGVANTREPHVRSGGQAAGTLRCDCTDNTATTSLIKDPTAWHIAGYGDQ